MADKTIFELPAPTDPLEGSEVFPIDTGLLTFKLTLDALAAYVLDGQTSGVSEEIEWTTNPYEDIDVSAQTEDARNLSWCLKDMADEYRQMSAEFTHPSPNALTHVRVTAALAAGDYLLIGR